MASRQQTDVLRGSLDLLILETLSLHSACCWPTAWLMMAACLVACVVPTRRALSVERTGALRAE